MVTDAALQNWFTHHAPTDQRTIETYEQIRAKGLEFATLISNLTPQSADQTTAIRTVREAVMWANSSLACGGA